MYYILLVQRRSLALEFIRERVHRWFRGEEENSTDGSKEKRALGVYVLISLTPSWIRPVHFSRHKLCL
jgi:hypothetical protein